jgi:hypothetical protein
MEMEMENAMTAPAPRPSIDGRMRRGIAWKVLGKIMMLVGILTTAFMTMICGLWIYGFYLLATELPVIDGPGHEGISSETALVVEAPNEDEGVAIEYLWIDTHLPGSAVTSQSLRDEGARVYDVLLVDPLIGGQREVWFDITGWYGVW